MIVTSTQILQHRGIVEVRQVSHILRHDEFGRIHLLNVVLLDLLRLVEGKEKVEKGC